MMIIILASVAGPARHMICNSKLVNKIECLILLAPNCMDCVKLDIFDHTKILFSMWFSYDSL